MLAIAVVLRWAVSGPVFGWSDTWQLVINTGTTITLMVFVIQNTQSRDTQVLDELIRVSQLARNSLINMEEISEIDVERTKTAFTAVRAD